MARDRASRPEATPLRLFVAIDIPADVRASIQGRVASVRERHPRARWVPVQNQHVTLKFLGTTWPRLVEWVTGRVEEVALAHQPFDTRVAGLGAFPSPRRARVLWVGLEDPAGCLTAIAGDLDRALAKEFEPERRAFSAHLTVARFEPPAPLEEDLQEVAVESGPFPVERLVLYRSRLQRPAPVYDEVAAFALRGRAGP